MAYEELSDEVLLAQWYQAADAAAEAKQRAQDLHAEVQERKLGPYADAAQVVNDEQADDDGGDVDWAAIKAASDAEAAKQAEFEAAREAQTVSPDGIESQEATQ